MVYKAPTSIKNQGA